MLLKVDISRLRGFLKRRVDECYRRNFAKLLNDGGLAAITDYKMLILRLVPEKKKGRGLLNDFILVDRELNVE